jgi:hypothetical protein
MTEICFWLSLSLLAAGGIGALWLHKLPYRSGQLLTPANVLPVAVALASFTLFLPVNARELDGVETALVSIHTVMRMFVLDGDFESIAAFTVEPAHLSVAFRWLGAALYVLAPLLTFNFILSFFKDLTAYRELYTSYFSDLYVFSELNERSLSLAISAGKDGRRHRIVFTDVFESEEEVSFELREKARELKAICFKKDITAINWVAGSPNRRVRFFAIGNNEEENLAQSAQLVNRYDSRTNFELYIFSTGIESEILFSSVSGEGMHVRRVNPVRVRIDHLLYDHGYEIFRRAIPTETGEKVVRAVILGLGSYGTEFLKGLSWMGQMDGYHMEIHVFEQDPQAMDKFTAQCPELMAPERNGTRDPGEAHYDITIHSGVDVDSTEFVRKFRELGPVTFSFVSMGSDSVNIRNAAKLRQLSERKGDHPEIMAIVYASEKKAYLETVTDYRGHSYDLQFLGDLRSTYSMDTVVNSALYKEALQRHLKWGGEREFWAYEFNFHSSVAAAIHLELRRKVGISWAFKGEDELTEAERLALEDLEHRRWNAYMRSEGYCYSGSPDKASRNDLAKLHHDLIPYAKLSEEDKRKDSRVGTK